jgi:hypothetical protein
MLKHKDKENRNVQGNVGVNAGKVYFFSEERGRRLPPVIFSRLLEVLFIVTIPLYYSSYCIEK